MGNVPILVSVQGAKRLDRLSKNLKQAGRRDLQRELRREIRAEGKPVVTELRRAVMGVDVSSSEGGTAPPDTSTGLRAKVAKATGLSVTAKGIRFRVSGKRLGDFPGAAKYLEAVGRYARWRHPVFGNRDAWVEQSGEPWFYPTIRKNAGAFRHACHRAMEKTALKIRS